MYIGIMAKAFEIGKIRFETKKLAEEFIKAILHKYQFEEPLNNEDSAIILSLLERHPDCVEKTGIGIESIVVRQDLKYGTTRHFCLLRLDGEAVDFSIGKCFSSKPNDPLLRFKSSARRSVENQIISFLHSYFDKHADEQGMVICGITGVRVSKENAAVDHTPPITFDYITTTFIKENNITIENVQHTSSATYQIGQEFLDANLNSAFAEYHKDVANLRITTRTANLKQKKKDW